MKASLKTRALAAASPAFLAFITSFLAAWYFARSLTMSFISAFSASLLSSGSTCFRIAPPCFTLSAMVAANVVDSVSSVLLAIKAVRAMAE